MIRRTLLAAWPLVVVAVVLTIVTSGCLPTLWFNQTQELTGNITMQFINDTPYRASFTFGVWNSLERNPPGAVRFSQLRLEGQTASAVATLQCARNMAISTDELITRIIDTQAFDVSTFDPDAFDSVVHFSDAAAGSDLAAAATVGTAAGFERLLGVDFRCADELIFTFVQDPDAPGGFRTDFALLSAPHP
jgi:hypothetical protein